MLRRIRAKGIGIILMMLLCLAMPVQAASPYSLTIDYHYGDARTAIDGATFDVVMVASRDASGTGYTMVDPFTGSDVDPNAVNKDDVKAVAKSLQTIYAEAVAKATAGTAGQTVPQAAVVTTDAAGYASLGIDTAGLYLIWQDGSTGTAEQYYEAAPMLVYVPTVNDDGTTWQNDITIEPKTSRRPTEDGGDGDTTDPGDDGNPGDTGDDGDSGGSDHSSSGNKESSTAGDGGTTTQSTTKVTTEEMISAIEELGTKRHTGENASTEGSTDDEWLTGEETGSLRGNPDYLGGWISDGGFSGDNSPMRIYAAIAIFALIVLIAWRLRRKQRQQDTKATQESQKEQESTQQDKDSKE